jgi:hypothetical protein
MKTLMKKISYVIILVSLLSGCAHYGSTSSSRYPASWHSCFENLNAIVYRKRLMNNKGMRDFHLAGTLDDLEQGYGSEGMFSISGRTSNRDILLNNKRVEELLRDEAFAESEDVTRLNRSQAREVYDDMTSTPCVRNDRPYQRQNVAIGYCFGRAIVSHMHALRRGVDPTSMKKIWVVGPMRGNWGHHVAHMIRADDGSWWVIDNVTGLVKHDEWIQRLNGFKNTNKELMYFVTEASRFGPRKNFTYNTVNLFNVQNRNYDAFDYDNDYYKGFFRDLFEHLDESPNPTPFERAY